MKTEEKQILEKLSRGDEIGMRELFNTYYRPLNILALKYINSIDQAEDIVQDTLIRFWNNKSFDNINIGLKPYLFNAVKNNCLNHIRLNSKLRFEEIEDTVNTMVDEEIDEHRLEELKIKLIKEIDTLPPKGREILMAIAFNGMKYKEVASQYGISVNTVKTQYSRTLSKLRNSLDILAIILLT